MLHMPVQDQLFTRFSVLIGPINHIKHLISKERLPFSIAYLTSLGLTLYFSLGVSCPFLSYVNHIKVDTQAHSYLGSLIGAIVQVRSSFPTRPCPTIDHLPLPGHCARLIRPRILPRGHPNAPLRRPDGPPRRREPASLLTRPSDYAAPPSAGAPAYYISPMSATYRSAFVRSTRISQHAFLLSWTLTFSLCAYAAGAPDTSKTDTRSSNFVRRRRYIITYCTIVAVAVTDMERDLIQRA